MAKGQGSIRYPKGRGIGIGGGGGEFFIAPAGAYSISDMKHQDMARDLKKAINKFTNNFGLPTTDIQLAPLDGAYGATFLSKKDGRTFGIYLDSKHFDVPKSEFARNYKDHNYKGGKNRFKNRTSSPTQHTMTHELAHSFWNSRMKGEKQKAAKKEITKLFKQYKADNKKKGYGQYSTTNVNEFWAEIVTSTVHQNRKDRYTTGVRSIINKYLK